ncbi:MAG TPA: beta-ketoacyl-ACP synthase II [Anaerolineae bacterium]|nr:beta-ketoacyl-ACP synthase II [Anaerolineae bacterium]
MRKRVVITGMGTLNPVGNDVPTFWDGLVAGRSGAGPITAYDASDEVVRIAAEVKGFDPVALFGSKQVRRSDRFTQLCMAAADQAIADAGLVFDEDGDNRHVTVIIGTGIGGVGTLLEGYDTMLARGSRRVSALMVPMMMPNAGAGEIAIRYGLHGLAMSLNSACATGTNALGEGAERIRRGAAEIVICGGGESVMHPLTAAALSNMGAVSCRNDDPLRASRPFDADRDGFVIGEGAGVMILEGLDHARARGAHIYAEVIGYGSSCDAFHITAPDEEGVGAARSMQAALDDAGLPADEIDYINAHGTSTPLNDPMETRAIRNVFGKHAYRVPISSTKSMVGHLMGAAGAVEAIACAKTLETGVVHPTINYETPDPECDLDYVPNEARETHPRTALSNSFGFGGHNSTLILARWEG